MTKTRIIFNEDGVKDKSDHSFWIPIQVGSQAFRNWLPGATSCGANQVNGSTISQWLLFMYNDPNKLVVIGKLKRLYTAIKRLMFMMFGENCYLQQLTQTKLFSNLILIWLNVLGSATRWCEQSLVQSGHTASENFGWDPQKRGCSEISFKVTNSLSLVRKATNRTIKLNQFTKKYEKYATFLRGAQKE